jgi:hypothetical protein
LGAKYGGITFEANYSRTFAQFKGEFENTWVFKKIPEKERLSELKKAFRIATKKTAEIKVSNPEVITE